MNKNYRTLATLTVLAMSAFAAQAQSPFEGDLSNTPDIQSVPSTLTRAAVVAELQTARANGTLARDGDLSQAPRSIAQVRSTLSRDAVRAEAIAAAKADAIVQGDH